MEDLLENHAMKYLHPIEKLMKDLFFFLGRRMLKLLNEFHYRIVEEFLCLKMIEHRVFVEFFSNVLDDFETKSTKKKSLS